MSLIRKAEHAVFYFLLERNIKQNRWRVDMPNGCLYLLPKYDVDVLIKTSKLMRRESTKDQGEDRQ